MPQPSLYLYLRSKPGYVLGVLLAVLACTHVLAATALPKATFRDLVTFNHYEQAVAEQMTIGIEVEMTSLPAEKVAEILIEKLGGVYAGTRVHGTETAHFIEGTRIGTIRLEPVNLQRIMNRWKQTHPNGTPIDPALNAITRTIDASMGQIEIVTEPLDINKVEEFGRALDALGLAGAKGSSNLGRLVSTQVNIGIDASDPILIKNILANYYRNAKAIRKEIDPILLRRGYIRGITPKFLAKLDERNWQPTIEELFDWYKANSPGKLSCIQLFCALIVNDSNFSRFEQPKAGKERVRRPVAEFREANTVFSTPGDPTRSSRNLMREVRFAVSLVTASKTTGDINFAGEQTLALSSLPQSDSAPGPDATQDSFRDTLAPKYYVALKTKKVENAEVLFANPELLKNWGIAGSSPERNAQILERLAVEVDHSESPTGSISKDPRAAIATSHDDNAGGIGDGRALVLQDSHGVALGIKGSGLTPYQPQKFAMLLGMHTGGSDGKMKLSEGIRVWLKGEMLEALGITSERVVGLIDNKGSAVVGAKSSPSAMLLRELPGGGIRNSHLNVWDAPQTRRALEYLKSAAQAKTGKLFSDAVYVAFDAARTAEIAAKMQDLFLAHGALAKGNVLAYPGLVDIAGMQFMTIPDPEFIQFAYRSRFGNQAKILRHLMDERRKAYAKTNPALSKLNANHIFDTTYQRELTILTLTRLGLDRATAVAVYSANPRRAERYSFLIWEAQLGRLKSDINLLQALIVENHAALVDGSADIEGVALKIRHAANEHERVFLKGRKDLIAKIKNTLRNNYSAIRLSETKTLLELGTALLKEGIERGKPGFADTLATRARARIDFSTNLQAQVDKAVSAALTAKENGDSAGFESAMSRAQNFIKEFHGRAKPYQPVAAERCEAELLGSEAAR